MKRLFLLLAAAFGASALLVQAQTAPANDNPMAGLNLGSDAPKSSWASTAATPFLAKFAHHLVVLSDDRLKAAPADALGGVQYVAFYYSAKWCPPCRVFSPKLVEFYNGFKKSHPNFELIFVDEDQDVDGMLAYMRMDKMAWPAVAHDDIESPALNARQFAGDYIPCLVLVDASGKVLADTNVDGQYAGPEQVVNRIKALVPKPTQATASL